MMIYYDGGSEGDDRDPVPSNASSASISQKTQKLMCRFLEKRRDLFQIDVDVGMCRGRDCAAHSSAADLAAVLNGGNPL